MKYFKHMMDGRFLYFRPEGNPNTSFPNDPNNMDYALMMKGVDADPPTNTIEEIVDTE